MIGERLTELLADHNLTADELAHRAQIDPGNLALYLTDQAHPCPLEQRRLALTLHVPVEALYPDPLAA